MARSILSTTFIVLALAAPAAAHVTLERGEAPVGSSYRAELRVPHGCGGKPTIAVRVRVPEGFIAVKPMPTPGWRLEKVRGGYETDYDYHGSSLTEGVKEIVWSDGNLPDDQ